MKKRLGVLSAHLGVPYMYELLGARLNFLKVISVEKD